MHLFSIVIAKFLHKKSNMQLFLRAKRTHQSIYRHLYCLIQQRDMGVLSYAQITITPSICQSFFRNSRDIE
ncbi:MAG: hypothetical protein CL607_06190 [Anaerolineaceae bacterium]|nr:hypothetical protein [Anaerolineaceae bacterium]